MHFAVHQPLDWISSCVRNIIRRGRNFLRRRIRDFQHDFADESVSFVSSGVYSDGAARQREYNGKYLKDCKPRGRAQSNLPLHHTVKRLNVTPTRSFSAMFASRRDYLDGFVHADARR